MKVFEIYVFDNPEKLAEVLDYIAMIFKSGVFDGIIKIGVILALYFASNRLKDGDLKGFFIQLGWIFATFAFFLTPNSKVAIIDARVYYQNETMFDRLQEAANNSDKRMQFSKDIGGIAIVDNIPFFLLFI